MLDLSTTHRTISTVRALSKPKIGDVFKYGTRHLVIIQVVNDVVTIAFFDKTIISSPYEASSFKTMSLHALESKFMDPDGSGKSMLNLISRGFVDIDEDWLCAGCPVGQMKVRRMVEETQTKTSGWLKKNLPVPILNRPASDREEISTLDDLNSMIFGDVDDK